MELLVGVVCQLRRFPLRSALGESPTRARLLPGGFEHDRGWHLLDAGGEVVTARRAPALAALTATVGPGGDLLVAGSAPGGPLAERLAGPGARFAGASFVGASAPHRAGAAVHLVTVAAPGTCGPDDRANVVVSFQDRDGFEPGDERGWLGRRLRLGGALLVATRTPRRCPGVYAEVQVAGDVAVGDPVSLLDAG